MISSQPIIACNTSNNAYQPAQLFLLSTEVVEDTPAGKVGCPSDVTTNQEIWAVLVIHKTDHYYESCDNKQPCMIYLRREKAKTITKGVLVDNNRKKAMDLIYNQYWNRYFTNLKLEPTKDHEKGNLSLKRKKTG